MMKTTPLLVAFAALLIALVGGWVGGVSEDADRDRALRALQASALRDDLFKAHSALLGAHVNLYERDFVSASRRLEETRNLLRLAEARGKYLGWQDEVKRLDFARFESDIDEAQWLLGRLNQGPVSPVPRGQGPFERVPGSAASLPR